MEGGGHEPAPDRGEHGETDRSSSPDDGEVPGGHGQHVAEQVADEIVAVAARREREHDKAEGQGGVGQDAQQGIGREPGRALEGDEEERNRDGDPEHADPETEVEDRPQRYPEQSGMGHRVAEVGHPAPQQNTADRGCDARHPRRGEERAHEEVIQHRALPARGLAPPLRRGRARDRGCAGTPRRPSHSDRTGGETRRDRRPPRALRCSIRAG